MLISRRTALFIPWLVASLTSACAPSGIEGADTGGGSHSQAFTQSQLRSDSNAKAGADKAVALLEEAGWCEIPSSSLPSGMAHSDLIRHMACIANKESTFGKYRVAQGGTTPYGHAYGFWQIVTGHMGKSLNVGGTRYSCPASSVNSLKSDDLVSAKCALYVYMDSLHRNGNSGLAPWEAVCSASDRNLLRKDGSAVFRPACQNRSCQKAPKVSFEESVGEVHVELDSKCDGDQIRFVFVKSNGTKVSIPSGSSSSDVQVSSVVNGKAVASYAAAVSLGFDAVRVIVEKNGQEIYRTNPSPRLPK